MSTVGWIVLVLFFCLYWAEKILGGSGIFFPLLVALAISFCIYKEWFIPMIIAIAVETILYLIIAYVKKEDHFPLATFLITLVIKGGGSIGVYFLIQHMR